MQGFNLKEFTAFFDEYQQRFVHFATTYLHDEVVAEDTCYRVDDVLLGEPRASCR